MEKEDGHVSWSRTGSVQVQESCIHVYLFIYLLMNFRCPPRRTLDYLFDRLSIDEGEYSLHLIVEEGKRCDLSLFAGQIISNSGIIGDKPRVHLSSSCTAHLNNHNKMILTRN